MKNDSLPFLDEAMIEKQVLADLQRFCLLTNTSDPFPVFADEVLTSLHGVEVEYVDSILSVAGEELLGRYLSNKKTVQVNRSANVNEGMVSFTLAHELGHVSLHNYLHKYVHERSLCSSASMLEDKERSIEWQADRYASTILMPEYKVVEILKKYGYSRYEEIDLTEVGKKLREYFGVSFQALEVRLSQLGIQAKGGLYDYQPRKRKISEKVFDQMEVDRSGWLNE